LTALRPPTYYELIASAEATKPAGGLSELMHDTRFYYFAFTYRFLFGGGGGPGGLRACAT
jgi:hypothetical protein